MKELPKGWEWVTLGEMCNKPEYGYTTSAKPEGNGPKFLRTTDISNGEVDWGAVPYCKEPPQDEDKYLLKDGDILISRAGSVGESIVIKNTPRAIFASYLIRFQPKEELSSKYAGYYLKSNFFRAQLTLTSSGTTLKGVNASNLSKIKIPLPPLDTQRKIVAILEKAEATQRLRAEADALVQQLVRTVFLEQFGDPVFNPMHWKIVQLKDLGQWTSGSTPSRSKPEYFQGDIPWYTTGELNDSFLFDSTEHISEDGLNSSRALKVLPAGTMLIGMYDSAAFKLGILTKPSSFNQACAAFSPNNKIIDTIFALYLFKMMKKVFLQSRRGIRQKNLNQAIIKDFEVPLPPLHLQEEFSKSVRQMYHIRVLQQRSTQELEAFTRSLFSKAFTGDLIA